MSAVPRRNALHRELERAFAEVRRLRPGLPACDEALVARVASVLVGGTVSRSSLHLDDLLLANGCLRRERTAIERFHAMATTSLRRAIAKIEANPVFIEEIEQEVLVRCLTPENGEPPRLIQYSGIGSLRSWVAVIGVRIALNRSRARRDGPLADDQPLLELSGSVRDANPELEAARGQLAERLNEVLLEVLRGLPAADRSVLRLYFVDRLTVVQLGTLLGIDKSNVSRRLQRIERDLTEATRRRLRESLGHRPGLIDSSMRLFSGALPVRLSHSSGCDSSPLRRRPSPLDELAHSGEGIGRQKPR